MLAKNIPNTATAVFGKNYGYFKHLYLLSIFEESIAELVLNCKKYALRLAKKNSNECNSLARIAEKTL